MAVDARALLFLGFAMLSFGSINAFIGYNLIGERGVENKARISQSSCPCCVCSLSRCAVVCV